MGLLLRVRLLLRGIGGRGRVRTGPRDGVGAGGRGIASRASAGLNVLVGDWSGLGWTHGVDARGSAQRGDLTRPCRLPCVGLKPESRRELFSQGEASLMSANYPIAHEAKPHYKIPQG